MTISQETFDRLYATYQYNGGSIATELLIKEGIGEQWVEFDKKAQAKYDQELKAFAATITSTNEDTIYQEIAKTDYKYCTSQNKRRIVEFVLENNKPAPSPAVKQEVKTPVKQLGMTDREFNKRHSALCVISLIYGLSLGFSVITGGTMAITHTLSQDVNAHQLQKTETLPSLFAVFTTLLIFSFIAGKIVCTEEYKAEEKARWQKSARTNKEYLQDLENNVLGCLMLFTTRPW